MKKIIVIILIVLAICGIYYYFEKNKNNSKEIDRIESYDYVLYGDDSNLYKSYFNELKEMLENNYNEEEYAKMVSKLFVADFYDLKNKKSNTDIGGTSFMHPNALEGFKKSARNTIYKFVGSSKELPSVKEVSVADSSLDEDKTYTVILNVTYDQDLDYPKNVQLKLVLLEKKLYIIEIK